MAGQKTYTRKGDDNPWRLNDLKTPEEWLQFALWYPYSVRELVYIGCWFELARCGSQDSAYHVMKALAATHHAASDCYIVVECA